MGNFFKRWRRTLGITAAVVSVLLIVGWSRSHFFADRLLCALTSQLDIGFVSDKGTLSYATLRHAPSEQTHGWEWFSVDASKSGDPNGSEHIVWTWRFRGFGAGHATHPDDGSSISLWNVPYWFVTLSMILAAGLLMSNSKSRCPTEQKVDPRDGSEVVP